VRIDRTSLEPRFSVIGQEMWSDEDGFDFSAVSGICGSGIIEALAELFLCGVIAPDGTILDHPTSPRVVPNQRTFSYVLCDQPLIEVTQGDVRAIQLAKAALHAGARLLMDRYGVSKVDRIRLAGAFGSHIDPLYAMVLGMIPDCDLSQVTSAGNAAGTGAMMALLSAVARQEIEGVALRVEKVETAVEPRFQEHFVAAMGIPHGVEPYPELAKRVDLPAVQAIVRGRRGRRRD
jgi:uncharacterized 2Fe-2S/4Fe-4S cluster protein (DUF4445 family)